MFVRSQQPLRSQFFGSFASFVKVLWHKRLCFVCMKCHAPLNNDEAKICLHIFKMAPHTHQVRMYADNLGGGKTIINFFVACPSRIDTLCLQEIEC